MKWCILVLFIRSFGANVFLHDNLSRNSCRGAIHKIRPQNCDIFHNLLPMSTTLGTTNPPCGSPLHVVTLQHSTQNI